LFATSDELERRPEIALKRADETPLALVHPGKYLSLVEWAAGVATDE